MKLFEIAYTRTAEWKETSPSSMKFDVDGEEWFATLSDGRVNEHFINGMLACGPYNMDPTGDLQAELSASQKMRQAMVGFHTVGKWLVSLVEKYPKASINVTIYPASSSRSKIYQQLIDQLQSEIPGVKIDKSTGSEHGDVYNISREAQMKQASFPQGAWGQS